VPTVVAAMSVRRCARKFCRHEGVVSAGVQRPAGVLLPQLAGVQANVMRMFALAWAWLRARLHRQHRAPAAHWLILFFAGLAMVGSRAPRFDRLSNLLSAHRTTLCFHSPCTMNYLSTRATHLGSQHPAGRSGPDGLYRPPTHPFDMLTHWRVRADLALRS
jgi:hypothetical protein